MSLKERIKKQTQRLENFVKDEAIPFIKEQGDRLENFVKDEAIPAVANALKVAGDNATESDAHQ